METNIIIIIKVLTELFSSPDQQEEERGVTEEASRCTGCHSQGQYQVTLTAPTCSDSEKTQVCFCVHACVLLCRLSPLCLQTVCLSDRMLTEYESSFRSPLYRIPEEGGATDGDTPQVRSQYYGEWGQINRDRVSYCVFLLLGSLTGSQSESRTSGLCFRRSLIFKTTLKYINLFVASNKGRF